MVMGISALLHLSFLLLLLPTVALTANINLETSMRASEDSLPWISSSGEFAFGFRKLDENPDHFLLAIWFEKVPDKTIVWSANGNDPAWRGSQVKLTNNGALVLYDPQGKESWKRPEGNSKSSSAAMQDDGNFVLLDGNSKPIWQSFKEPTDTILPGQILDMPTHLTSRRTPGNYSDGRFQFRLQDDGNLVLYPISESTESIYAPYWASGTVNTKPQLVCDKAGYIYLKETQGTNRIFNLTNVDMSPMQNFYHLARIDYDGVFRQYSYSKEEKCNLSWRTVRKYPEDICFAITGNAVTEKMCEQLCREDCFCAAAIYNGNHCWKKKYPLSNGRSSTSVNRIALLKVPKDGAFRLFEEKKDQSTLILIVSVLLGSSVFLNIFLILAIFLAVYFSYHKWLLQSFSSVSGGNLRSYTYKELEEATGGFKQVLGKGAFGTVYKGVIRSDAKRFVAVKKLDKMEHEGEREFKTEVSVIGQTHHKNLVRLLGFCDEGEHRLLVYEYMSNGSLASFLFGISRPNWNQRVQIVLGIARGLMYLHEECSTQIIHCDIKPQNILLDECFTARISDFGLAKLLLADQTRAARTGIRGTIGYFAPEWFRKATITVKVDVYSFGVMLLEIICCKSSVAFSMGNQEEEALMDWIYECYKGKQLEKLTENDEEASNDMKRVERAVKVALWCIQEDASLRPSMKKVTQMLEGVIEVSVPPYPWNLVPLQVLVFIVNELFVIVHKES
ncbi:hypothetical protein Dsin_011053 [Dipteronia sinensis]|uniref:Receptor-like serine/threonine-protein kinase n=1 Tax=Dipteronia sinensis TaxID=43782 RepID=A0AAE0AUE7_9ROSI|nr:hypothetical protein Dsin_011053 [Dipteronia sinensis]